MVYIAEMKCHIQEWFAQETDFTGLVNLCVELKLEIEKQMHYMTDVIGKEMAENGLFDTEED